MKLDRRTFLTLGAGFAAGGAIGTTLSPLPWKLTDDASIWTQNWPWTPVPEKGEVTFEQTTCGLCPGGCGVTVRKVVDRAVKIEGTDGHPVNHGGICPLGISGLQLLYGPTRVPRPLKRAGARGEGKWTPITWSEALVEVTNKLGAIRSQGGAHTVACMLGRGTGSVPGLFRRFMEAYGSPNVFTDVNGWDAMAQVMQYTQGPANTPGYDLENADLILSFGSAVIEGWGSPVRMIHAYSGWRSPGNGRAALVQVEPRLSKTAAKADKWIAIKPGTESALAYGIAHVLIMEDMINKNFVRWYSVGFDADEKGNRNKGFRQNVLDHFSPAQVEKITGVPKDEIVALARAFGKAEKPVAISGANQAETWGNLYDHLAVHCLNALKGRINQPGGVRADHPRDIFTWPEVTRDALAVQGLRRPRVDGAGTRQHPLASQLPSLFADAVLAKKPYPIQALLVYGADPAYTTPDAEKFKKALKKIPFIVSFASHMNDTADMADLILPDHAFLEKLEDVPSPPGVWTPTVGLMQPVVKPTAMSQHAGDTILEIASNLGGSVSKSFPWRNYEAVLEKSLGGKLDIMKKQGYWQPTDHGPEPWSRAFTTLHRRFDFAPKVFSRFLAGPVELVPRFADIEPAGDKNRFPLVLMPYVSLRLANQAVGDPPFMVKALPDSMLLKNDQVIQLNPKTAKAYGLGTGKKAKLTTPAGEAIVRVQEYDGMPPNTIGLPKGLGHTGYDDYLAGKGSNYNALAGRADDPVTGHNAAYGIRAKLVAL